MTLDNFITMLNAMRERHGGDIPIHLKTRSNSWSEEHPDKIVFVEEMNYTQPADSQVSRYFNLIWVV